MQRARTTSVACAVSSSSGIAATVSARAGGADTATATSAASAASVPRVPGTGARTCARQTHLDAAGEHGELEAAHGDDRVQAGLRVGRNHERQHRRRLARAGATLRLAEALHVRLEADAEHHEARPRHHARPHQADGRGLAARDLDAGRAQHDLSGGVARGRASDREDVHAGDRLRRDRHVGRAWSRRAAPRRDGRRRAGSAPGGGSAVRGAPPSYTGAVRA